MIQFCGTDMSTLCRSLLLFSVAPFPGKCTLKFKFSGLGTGEEEEGSRDGQEDGGEAAGGHQVSKP